MLPMLKPFIGRFKGGKKGLTTMKFVFVCQVFLILRAQWYMLLWNELVALIEKFKKKWESQPTVPFKFKFSTSFLFVNHPRSFLVSYWSHTPVFFRFRLSNFRSKFRRIKKKFLIICSQNVQRAVFPCVWSYIFWSLNQDVPFWLLKLLINWSVFA